MASFNSLPTEIILNIASWLHPSLSSLNSLSQANKQLFSTLERLLYTEDVQHHQSSSVYWAVKYGELTTLRKTLTLGKAHVPTRGDYASTLDDGSPRKKIRTEGYRGLAYGNLEPSCHWDIIRDHPICIATRAGHEDVVRFLLDEVGCSPEIRDRADFCLLSLAIANNGPNRDNRALVKLFLDLDVRQYARSANSFFPLHIAAYQGDQDTVEKLLSTTELRYLGQQVQQAFETAVIAGQIPVALRLLEHGVNVNCYVHRWTSDGRYYQQTPLGWAVPNDSIELAEKLCDNGASADMASASGGRVVLFDAVERKNLEMVDLLAKRTTDSIACTRALSLAVHSAVGSSRSSGDDDDDPASPENQIVEILLNNAIDCNFIEHDIRQPPTQPQFLGPLESHGVICTFTMPLKRKENGKFIPPIVHAVQAGNMRLVQLLLSYGTDVNTSYRGLVETQSKSCCGRIVNLATDLGHQDIVELLLKAGADPALGRPPADNILKCSNGVSCPVWKESVAKRWRDMYPPTEEEDVNVAQPNGQTSQTG